MRHRDGRKQNYVSGKSEESVLFIYPEYPMRDLERVCSQLLCFELGFQAYYK